jgi:hypothetical protein
MTGLGKSFDGVKHAGLHDSALAYGRHAGELAYICARNECLVARARDNDHAHVVVALKLGEGCGYIVALAMLSALSLSGLLIVTRATRPRRSINTFANAMSFLLHPHLESVARFLAELPFGDLAFEYLRRAKHDEPRHWFRASLARDQHDSETRFALHHTRVCLCGPFERDRLHHRANLLEHAECEGVLVVNRRTRESTVNRARPED